jgi:6-pyruvoyl tetrahydropterin synthase/QueD family protein
MFRICKSVDIDFAHHIRGHDGPCVHIHGHTWKFEVVLAARTLDADGFVVDFKRLKNAVLQPCHALLDHSLAIGAQTWDDVHVGLETVGAGLLQSRIDRHGAQANVEPNVEALTTRLAGAENRWPGGMKVAVFPFSPTSERLAQWLWQVADGALGDERVTVELARVYETLHPVESVAEYAPDR